MLRRAAWVAVAAVLLSLRLGHLSGPLDDPHSWTQCDAANYSLDFYRHGIDLLHPAVCWLGSHRTLILEFPLPEAMSALLYRAFAPDPRFDRMVSLAFFIAATAYLFAFVRLIASRRLAWLSTIAYLALPLGQYYSRAPQVDFAATAFAHALLYHAAVGLKRRSPVHVAMASVSGALAAMIKAPYLIPVLGPLALAVLAAPGLRALWVGGVSLGATTLAFVLWRRHVDAVNGAAPDWQFLPGFYKEVNPLSWYVGSWAQRLEGASWIKLARRLVLEVATPPGSLLAMVGVFASQRRGPTRVTPRAVALAWCAAACAYLWVFFPLNVIHNYYQVPFLAPVAVLVALGADLLWERAPRVRSARLGAIAFAAFVVVAALAVYPLGYYRVDWLRVEAGRLIAEGIPRGDLVVVADHGSGYSDPRLLFRADHAGWPLAMGDIDHDRRC